MISSRTQAFAMHEVDRFANRHRAGRRLGEAVAKLRLPQPVTVLGLPRGGVPVAFEVAQVVNAPLDVLCVRKLSMPGQPEMAIGAVAVGDVVAHESGATPFLPFLRPSFPQLAANEKCELRRRESLYRGGLPPLDIAGHHVVLVDDGIDTASSMLAAIRAAKRLRAASVTVASPVAAAEALRCVAEEADRVVILETPPILFAIAEWYEHFGPVDDIEVGELLARAARRHPFRPPVASHT